MKRLAIMYADPHYHCPNDCGDHPQPFHAEDGHYYCGRCWHFFGELVDMELCTPETCPGEVLNPNCPRHRAEEKGGGG